jgi:hypothetical protein
MSFKLNGFILLLSMLLILSGCGDLLGKKVQERAIDTSSINPVTCKLDVDQFTQILNENIAPQIRCLGESLNFFIKIVKSGKPGYLSRVQLENYISKFEPDIKPEVVRALKSIFDLGHLITGEDPNYISKETVDKVINFAIIFNDKAATYFGPTFEGDQPIEYRLHQLQRRNVGDAMKSIVKELKVILNTDRGGKVHKLNIIELLESFSTESNRRHIEKIKKVLFLKKVLVGGENEVITHIELERLIQNLDQFIVISLDAVKYKKIKLNQEDLLDLLRTDVGDLYRIIHAGSLNDRDDEVLFTVDEAIAGVKLLLDDSSLDIDKYTKLIREGKKLVMHGNGTEVKGIELKNLFAHATSLLQTGTIFHRIYAKFKPQLESPLPVTINFDEYRHTYPGQQAELDQFERIVKKYRFFKGEFLSPYYSRGQKRNADAIFETALIEYGLKLIFASYGSPSTGTVGGYSMDREQMQKLIKTFENELVEMGLLLPNRAIGTADNISLLGSLFQYQSDTNKLLDINEGTEFATTLFSSLNVQDDIEEYFNETTCSRDEFGRINPVCFRANFWKGLCSYYRPQFPLLFESIGLSSRMKCEDYQNTPEAAKFLDRAIEASRACNRYPDGAKEEIPYAASDVMPLTVALMHIETTVLRWDANNNNIMDPDEVDRAYEIYAPALDGFMENKSPIIKKLKKQIYQYMIKYGEVPDEKDYGSVWKFVRFLLSFNKKSNADRTTIASILVAIGEENKKLRTEPEFDCKLLRDPENIPREKSYFTPVKQEDTRPDLSHLLLPFLN